MFLILKVTASFDIKMILDISLVEYTFYFLISFAFCLIALLVWMEVILTDIGCLE